MISDLIFSAAVKKGHKGVDLLASLCNKYNTSEEELRKTMRKTNDLIENILKKKPLLAPEHKNESLKNIDSGIFKALGMLHNCTS